MDDIVTIDIDWKQPEYKPEFQIVFDLSFEELVRLAEDAEERRVFTFPFYTGTVEDVPDMSVLETDEYNFLYLVQPMYVGNFEDPIKAATEYINQLWRSMDYEFKFKDTSHWGTE